MKGSSTVSSVLEDHFNNKNNTLKKSSSSSCSSSSSSFSTSSRSTSPTQGGGLPSGGLFTRRVAVGVVLFYAVLFPCSVYFGDRFLHSTGGDGGGGGGKGDGLFASTSAPTVLVDSTNAVARQAFRQGQINPSPLYALCTGTSGGVGNTNDMSRNALFAAFVQSLTQAAATPPTSPPTTPGAAVPPPTIFRVLSPVVGSYFTLPPLLRGRFVSSCGGGNRSSNSSPSNTTASLSSCAATAVVELSVLTTLDNATATFTAFLDYFLRQQHQQPPATSSSSASASTSSLPLSFAFDCSLTAIGLVMDDLQSGVEGDLVRIDTVSVPVAVVLLILCTGTWRMLVLPLVLIPTAIFFGYALLYPLSRGSGGPLAIDSLSPEMAAALMVAIAVDYSLFLATRFREEVRRRQFEEQMKKKLQQQQQHQRRIAAVKTTPEHQQQQETAVVVVDLYADKAKEQEEHEGKDEEARARSEVVRRTTMHTAHNICVSGVTIAVALAAVAVLPSDALVAMGVVFVVGTFSCVVVAMTLVPAVLLLGYAFLAPDPVPAAVVLASMRAGGRRGLLRFLSLTMSNSKYSTTQAPVDNNNNSHKQQEREGDDSKDRRPRHRRDKEQHLLPTDVHSINHHRSASNSHASSQDEQDQATTKKKTSAASGRQTTDGMDIDDCSMRTLLREPSSIDVAPISDERFGSITSTGGGGRSRKGSHNRRQKQQQHSSSVPVSAPSSFQHSSSLHNNSSCGGRLVVAAAAAAATQRNTASTSGEKTNTTINHQEAGSASAAPPPPLPQREGANAIDYDQDEEGGFYVGGTTVVVVHAAPPMANDTTTDDHCDETQQRQERQEELVFASLRAAQERSPYYKAALFATRRPLLVLVLLSLFASPLFYLTSRITLTFALEDQVPRGSQHLQRLAAVQRISGGAPFLIVLGAGGGPAAAVPSAGTETGMGVGAGMTMEMAAAAAAPQHMNANTQHTNPNSNTNNTLVGNVLSDAFFNATHELVRRLLLSPTVGPRVRGIFCYAYTTAGGYITATEARTWLQQATSSSSPSLSSSSSSASSTAAPATTASEYRTLYARSVDAAGSYGLVSVVPAIDPFGGTDAVDFTDALQELLDDFRQSSTGSSTAGGSMSSPPVVSFVGLTGASTSIWATMRAVLDRFPFQVVATFVGIYVFIAVVFRSLFIPMRMIATVAFTIGCAFGTGVLVFQTLPAVRQGLWPSSSLPSSGGGDSNGFTWTVPVFCFALLCALALDYDIFLLTRIVELKALGFTDQAAVVKAVYRTGRVISYAGLIMATALGSLMLSSVTMLNQFGLICAVAVLVDAFLVRPLLVPALMSFMPCLVWWPRRFHYPHHSNDTISTGSCESDNGSDGGNCDDCDDKASEKVDIVAERQEGVVPAHGVMGLQASRQDGEDDEAGEEEQTFPSAAAVGAAAGWRGLDDMNF